MASSRQGRASTELRQRLVRTIEEWGRAQKGLEIGELGRITVDALLQTVTMIVVYRGLSSSGLTPATVQEYARALNRDEPVAGDADDAFLAWQARKEVLLEHLARSVRVYSS